MTNPTKFLAEGLRKINEAAKCADKTTPIDGSHKMQKPRGGKPKAKAPQPPTQAESTAAAVLAILGEDSVKSIHEAQRAVAAIQDFAESNELNFDSVLDNFVRWGEKRGYENIPANRQLVDQWLEEMYGKTCKKPGKDKKGEKKPAPKKKVK